MGVLIFASNLTMLRPASKPSAWTRTTPRVAESTSAQVGSSQVFKDSGGTDGGQVKEGPWRIRTVSTARTTARQVGVACGGVTASGASPAGKTLTLATADAGR